MRIRSVLCGLLSSCLVLATVPVQAEMIGSTQLLSPSTAPSSEKVDAFLARGDVQQQLEALGVHPAQATERVASLTDEELRTLSRHIEDMPAGAGVAELVVVVLLVLIVLELLGAINIFSKI